MTPEGPAERYARWARVAALATEHEGRAVLADQIAEEDPALGTFVALQLAAAERDLEEAERAEMVALLTRHLRDWLGPALDGLSPDEMRFSSGFLSVANLAPRDRRHALQLARAPQLLTLSQLSAPRYLPAILRSGAFPALRTLGTAFLHGRGGIPVVPGWGHALAPDTLHGIELPSQVRGLQVDLGTPTRVHAFFNCFGRASLAAIRELAIVCEGRISRRVLDEFPPELERLSLAVPPEEVGTWIGLARQLFPRLKAIDVARGTEVQTFSD